jgi:hypothetical protein
MIARIFRDHRLLLVPATIVFATLACSCMWGVVRNANTGAPVAGASVTFWDENGNERTTMTDANGIYYFDPSTAAPAALGDVTFFVTGPNTEARREKRPVDYAENPGASLSNLSSFWEVQTFDIAGQPGSYHDVTQGYTIVFPDGWFVEPQPDMDETPLDSAVYAAPLTFAPDDLTACDVESSMVPPGGIPDEWWRDEPEDVTVVSRGTAQIAGRTATKVVLELNLEDVFTMKAVMYVFERDGQGWVIVCMADSDTFQSKTRMFNGVAKSFKFD